MITRCGLHDEIELLDKQIEELNNEKRDCFDAYRAQLEGEGLNKAQIRTEIDAFKKAERKLRALRKNEDGVLEKDALVDEILAELQRGTLDAFAPARVRGARDEIPDSCGGVEGHTPNIRPQTTDRLHPAEHAGVVNSDSAVSVAGGDAPQAGIESGPQEPIAEDDGADALPTAPSSSPFAIPPDLSIPDFLRRNRDGSVGPETTH